MLERIAEALDIPLNILVFIASDKTELTGLDKDVAEKLSLLAWRLIENDDESTVLQK